MQNKLRSRDLCVGNRGTELQIEDGWVDAKNEVENKVSGCEWGFYIPHRISIFKEPAIIQEG
jgi:hypothetical protein